MGQDSGPSGPGTLFYKVLNTSRQFYTREGSRSIELNLSTVVDPEFIWMYLILRFHLVKVLHDK